MRFIYNPFSQSSSKSQVSNRSLQWLLKGPLASSLTAKFLQVTVTDHRVVSHQQALKNGCVQERTMVMELERQQILTTEQGSSDEAHSTSISNWLSSDHRSLSPLTSPRLWAWQGPPFYSIYPLPNLSPLVAAENHIEPFIWQCPKFGNHFSFLYIHAVRFDSIKGMWAKSHEHPNSRDNPIEGWSCG